MALNTLTSSGMVAASLAALTPGASLVEISKRGIWSAARVAQGALGHGAAAAEEAAARHCLQRALPAVMIHDPPPPALATSYRTAERPDVRYSLLAVDFMSPPAMHASLMRLSAGLAANQLRPLPLIAHGMGAVAAALRQMSQARHVGKVVVRHPPAQPAGAMQGSWLVTGGVGECPCLGALHGADAEGCCMPCFAAAPWPACRLLT